MATIRIPDELVDEINRTIAERPLRYTYSTRPACPNCGEGALTGAIHENITFCEHCKSKVVLTGKYGAVLPWNEA